MDGPRRAGRCAALALLAACCLARGGGAERQFLNEWAAEVPAGPDAARAIAEELDYDLVGQVGAGGRVGGPRGSALRPVPAELGHVAGTFPPEPRPRERLGGSGRDGARPPGSPPRPGAPSRGRSPAGPPGAFSGCRDVNVVRDE